MSLSILEWGLIAMIVVINFYLYGTCFYIYLNKRGVKNTRPKVPLVGDFYNILRRKENLLQAIDKVYKSFPGERYVGFYEVVNEIILLKDVELIKRICVDATDHFSDHRSFISERKPSLLCKNMFSLKGQKWRDMRSELNPGFDKNRINEMFPLLLDCTSNMLSHLNLFEDSGIHDIEMKDFFSRYISDVIASCAFGCQVNSFENSENEVYSYGKILSKAETLQFANIMAYSNQFFKTFDMKKSDEKACSYFHSVVAKCLKERELSKAIRNDFLKCIVDFKKEASSEFSCEQSNDDYIAQALCFFTAGFGPLSNLLTFLFHEIMSNPNIQTKLQNEIDNINGANGQSCEEIMNLVYLDMVISETLRKWPPLIATDRECTKPYTLPPANETAKTYTFLSKYAVWIPIYSIHHDEDHYPNPELFNPERFSKQNTSLRKSFTYIPFGVGPRNCIGSNFAILVAKTTVVYLLSRFNFVSSSKTLPDLSVCNEGLYLKPKNDVWLGIRQRHKLA